MPDQEIREASLEYHRQLPPGKISVTPLHIDLTHNATVHALRGVLGGAPPKARGRA